MHQPPIHRILALASPSDADIARVQQELRLDALQARNHLIGRQLVLEQLESERAARVRRCVDQWTAGSAA